MGGISAIFILMIVFLIIACVGLILAFICVDCFIGATVSAIVLILKRNDIKKSESKIGWKVSIPIVMYLISFSTFMLYLFMFIIYNMNQL